MQKILRHAFTAALVVGLLLFGNVTAAQAYRFAPFQSAEEAQEAYENEMWLPTAVGWVPPEAAISPRYVDSDELARRQAQSSSERVRELAFWQVMYQPGDVFVSDRGALYIVEGSEYYSVGNEYALEDGTYSLTPELEFEPQYLSGSTYSAPSENETFEPPTLDYSGPADLQDPNMYFAGHDVIYRVAELSWTCNGFAPGDSFTIRDGMLIHNSEYGEVALERTNELPDGEYALGKDYYFRSV